MTPFWTGERVARALGVAVDTRLTFTGVATDSRTLEDGALFVALAGERFDAHDFLTAAKRAGARGAVVRSGTPPTEGLAQIEVADTLRALGRLGRARRAAVPGPVVAVTGTNGKTAVKEMLGRALATRWNTHATKNNLNNLIGVPLSILAASADCEALVIEAAANELGEIRRLRDIVEPSVAVVTNVSTGHLQGFGSLEGALHEKVQLLNGAPFAVVGTNPPELAARARDLAGRVVTAGLEEPATVRPETWGLSEDGRGWCTFGGRRLELPVVGAHQLANASLVVAVAMELGLEFGAVARALETVSLPAGRCEVHRRGSLIVVQDTYNANPDSVRALLATAQAMRGGRRLVVILGSMLELGAESARLHEEVADAVLQADPWLVALTGEFIPAFAPHNRAAGPTILTAADAASLGKAVAARLRGDELIVVKGSRGVQMERSIPYLLPSDEARCSTIS